MKRIKDILKVLVFACCLGLLVPLYLFGQEDNPWAEAPDFELSGYLSVYYSFDFNEPTTTYRQPFFYNYNRHNEVNINNGNIGLAITQAKYRAKLTLQSGTYAIDNYAAEPEVLKNVYEANVGISLNRKNNLWLDAGILNSHLGFESPLMIDNYTLTQSIASDNLPYFMTGAKLTWSSEVVTLMGAVFNGWQQIQRTPGKSIPSYGMQVVITPNENITINYSNFYGSNDPDSTRRNRFFNDLFIDLQLVRKLNIIACVDFGFQQKEKGSSSYDPWYALTLVANYDFAEKWAAVLRGEYYQDKNLVNVTVDHPAYGFQTYGLSANINFTPVPALTARLEGRWLTSPDPIFTLNDGTTADNVFVTATLAVRMGKKWK
jgi:hypothetical protein